MSFQYNVTEFNKMIAYLAEHADKESEEYRLFTSYIELQKKRFLDEKNKSDRPFISIVTRTQGTRPDMFSEMLLCLTAQKDTDFELIIVEHNLDGAKKNAVSAIVDDLPQWMKERTVLLPVEGGTRTTPLLKGFEKARGLYVTALDDDDLVFDNWISSFREAYEKGPGKVLHSYAVHQDWEVVGNSYPNTPISMQKPVETFCRDFVLTDELTLNTCPLMTLAFPSYAYKVLNIRFDETLTTTEDWDFLMRTTFVCGIENIGNVTSVYRNWLNAENSQSAHNEQEWMDNYNRIVSRFKSTPVLLDEHSVEKIIQNELEDETDSDDKPIVLFYDIGNGFCDENTVSQGCSESGDWLYRFDGLDSFGKIRGIRIDPAWKGNVALENLVMQVEFGDGSKKEYGAMEVYSNAYLINGMLAFEKDDPQFFVKFKTPETVKSVVCNYELVTPIPDGIIEALFLSSGKMHSLWHRIKRKYRKIIKGL